jgi:hypothetical protein
LPPFPVPEEFANEAQYLRHLTFEGALPAYSVSFSTPPLNLAGQPVQTGGSGPDASYSVNHYSWPDTIDPDARRVSGGAPSFPYKPMPFGKVILDRA